MEDQAVPKPPQRGIRDLSTTEFLQRIQETSREALEPFGHYQNLGAKKPGHFCDVCKQEYKEYNDKERAVFQPTAQRPVYKEVFPKCTGSAEDPEIPYDEWKAMGGSDEEYDLIKINSDPVKWAAAELGFLTSGFEYTNKGKRVSADRWYQEYFLHCSAELKVYRCGRRVGKCLEKGTEVMTPKGPVEIQNLIPGDIVYGYDPVKDTTFETPVITLFDQGIKDVVDLERGGSSQVGATLDHRFHTTHERVSKKVRAVADLYKGCSITRKFVKAPMGSVHEPQAYALGALLGDGCSMQKGACIQISSDDEAVVEATKDSIGGMYYWKNSGSNFTWSISNYEQGYRQSSNKNVQIKSELYDKWCKGKKAHERLVSMDVLKTWNRESCLAFLAGILDTDGSVQFLKGKELFISFDSQSPDIINAVVFLIKSLFQKNPSVIKDDRDKYVNGPMLSVRVKNNLHCSRMLKELDPYIRCDRKGWSNSYEDINLNNENPDYLGVKIDKTRTRKAQCYDVEIGTKDHLFLLANGMVSHNSETMAIEVLFHLARYSNFNVILVAPFETQLMKFEEKLINWLNNSVDMQDNLFLKYNKTKHTMTFSNGSKYEGYCTGGDKQSKTADRVRGAGASLLVLDEADYISEDALQAVLAVKSDDPDCRILLSSTPSGKRGFFHKWCTSKDMGFKEWWVPSHSSPSYTEDADTLYRNTLSVDKYKKEYLGDFGTLMEALLAPEHINKCTDVYDMARLRQAGPRSGCRYILGVDWNGRRIGTNIIVVEFDAQQMKYKMVDKVVVKDTEHNYENSCWAVIKTFQHWDCDYVYADAGFGEMQCLCPETRVYTEEGPVALKDVEVGVRVLTHTGAYQRVLAKNINANTKSTITIVPRKGLPVKSSADHPHMVIELPGKFSSNMDLEVAKVVKVMAKDLVAGKHAVVHPRSPRSSSSIAIVDLAGIVPGAAHDLTHVWMPSGYGTGSVTYPDSVVAAVVGTSRSTLQRIRASIREGKKLTSAQNKVWRAVYSEFPNYEVPSPVRVSRKINLMSESFLRILGWYLSEGSASGNCIEFPQNVTSENDPYIKQMCEDIENVFGVKASVYMRLHPRLLARVCISSRVVTEFFKAIAGSGHESKHVPEEVFTRWNFAGPMLETLIKGDGSVTKAGGVRIGLCSEILVGQVRQMLINSGVLPSSYVRNYHNPKWKDLYIIATPADSYSQEVLYEYVGQSLKVVAGQRVQRKHFAVGEKFLISPIKSVEVTEPMRGLIDIEVEHDNTFIANGILTHNCEMIKKTAKQIGDEKLAHGYVPVRMGDNQEIRDPVDGKIVKKQNKEFAINLMINCFERGIISIPYSENYKQDDEDWGIIPQLYDLAISGYGPTGRPKWAESVDHTLTCMYLAILGFHMKMSDLGSSNIAREVFVVSHGDLKNLPGGVTIDGAEKRKREGGFDSVGKNSNIAGTFIPRVSGVSNPAGPMYGSIPTTVAKYTKLDEYGNTVVKYDNTIVGVRSHNLGTIERKTF